MSQSNLRIIVIGGGLGGLCLAQGLSKAGVTVDVYERDASLSIRTQGHRIHVDSRGEQALRECLPSNLYELYLATRGQPSKGMTTYKMVSGQIKDESTEFFPENGKDEFLKVGSAVDRLTLRQVLLAGLDNIVHFDKAFARYEKENEQIRVYFTDGTSTLGDILVAADGVGSRVRQQYLPQAEVADTGIRWLGGKTLLTDEIVSLLPQQMSETFGTFVGPHQLNVMLGCVWFSTPPIKAAAQFWPSLNFKHTQNFLMWGLLGNQGQFPIPDEALKVMESPDLLRAASEITQGWHPTLSTFIDQADPHDCFYLTMRQALPVNHWQTSNITLLGDAIHVKPANGSGANSALRDASQLARYLIAAANQEMPLHQALHDYEVDMLDFSAKTAQAAMQRLSGKRLGILPTPKHTES